MGDWALLRVMILKEIRTTFRERNQLAGLAIGIVVLVLVMGSTLYQATHAAREARAMRGRGPATVPQVPQVPQIVSDVERIADQAGLPVEARQTEDPPRQLRMILNWAALVVAAGLGVFFSLGYLLSAVLASFVGEKEARTLEVLLASPVSDGKLYLAKCISTLLPSAAIGYVFAASGVLLGFTFIPSEIIVLPAGMLFYALVLSIPIMLLPQVWLVGLGAAISAKAETVKGAGQVLSAAVMILMFGTIYGVPLVPRLFPPVRPALIDLTLSWLELPFLIQYALVLAALSLPAILLMALGKAAFRRDRMLT